MLPYCRALFARPRIETYTFGRCKMKVRPRTIILFILLFVTLSYSSNKNVLPKEAQKDIENLVKAASSLNAAWPWKGEIREVKKVARHGTIVAPTLVSLLKHEREFQVDWDLTLEQQIELTLCRIYNIVPESGKTVYGVRSLESKNVQVKKFWVKRIKEDRKE